jgi:hypothetical protein
LIEMAAGRAPEAGQQPSNSGPSTRVLTASGKRKACELPLVCVLELNLRGRR